MKVSTSQVVGCMAAQVWAGANGIRTGNSQLQSRVSNGGELRRNRTLKVLAVVLVSLLPWSVFASASFGQGVSAPNLYAKAECIDGKVTFGVTAFDQDEDLEEVSVLIDGAKVDGSPFKPNPRGFLVKGFPTTAQQPKLEMTAKDKKGNSAKAELSHTCKERQEAIANQPSIQVSARCDQQKHVVFEVAVIDGDEDLKEVNVTINDKPKPPYTFNAEDRKYEFQERFNSGELKATMNVKATDQKGNSAIATLTLDCQ